MIAEYRAITVRDKFKKYIKLQQAMCFIGLILPILSAVEIKSEVRASRDVDDNYLLALSQDGGADYLITGDPDLLVLKKHVKTTILTMAEFLELNPS